MKYMGTNNAGLKSASLEKEIYFGYLFRHLYASFSSIDMSIHVHINIGLPTIENSIFTIMFNLVVIYHSIVHFVYAE